MPHARVTSYQLAWNMSKNVGSLRLWLEGIPDVVEKDMDAINFIAVSTLLSAPGAEVVVGKDDAGQSFMIAGKKHI